MQAWQIQSNTSEECEDIPIPEAEDAEEGRDDLLGGGREGREGSSSSPVRSIILPIESKIKLDTAKYQMKITHQAKTTITNFKSHATILLLGGTHAELIVQLTLLYFSAIVIELNWDGMMFLNSVDNFQIQKIYLKWNPIIEICFGSWVLVPGTARKKQKNKKQLSGCTRFANK